MLGYETTCPQEWNLNLNLRSCIWDCFTSASTAPAGILYPWCPARLSSPAKLNSPPFCFCYFPWSAFILVLFVLDFSFYFIWKKSPAVTFLTIMASKCLFTWLLSSSLEVPPGQKMSLSHLYIPGFYLAQQAPLHSMSSITGSLISYRISLHDFTNYTTKVTSPSLA